MDNIMDREEAIRIVKANWPDGVMFSEALKALIPEFQEPMEERVRKAILAFMERQANDCVFDGITREECIKWLEDHKACDKQCTFKSLPRLLEMLEPTDKAKSYCKKLIDELETEKYVADANVVTECLKQMNDEFVPKATMDEASTGGCIEDVFKAKYGDKDVWLQYSIPTGKRDTSSQFEYEDNGYLTKVRLNSMGQFEFYHEYIMRPEWLTKEEIIKKYPQTITMVENVIEILINDASAKHNL